MLYLIGLGLGDAADITVKGLEAVRRCSRVYLEAYTSVLTVGKEALEEYYGKQLILADRDLVEQGAEEILKDADVVDVAFLVVGDPFGATTHSDLVLRAVNAGIPYRVIHNASIMNAVGCCGLQVRHTPEHTPDAGPGPGPGSGSGSSVVFSCQSELRGLTPRPPPPRSHLLLMKLIKLMLLSSVNASC
uniref:diphthine methyl ester synthase n=1 Tax=Lates calcarifer TaxID=8187 RepID=A0A4W6FWM8_LATCA